MNRTHTRLTTLMGLFAPLALGSFLVGGALAQEKTVQQVPAGEHGVKVELKHSKVIHVQGNHLVTQLEDGTLEAVLVPDDFRFHMDGRQLSVHDLHEGMMITEETITTTRPVILKTVEVKNGTIFFANGPHVTIRDENNKVHQYVIPEWSKVIINGEETSVYNLRSLRRWRRVRHNQNPPPNRPQLNCRGRPARFPWLAWPACYRSVPRLVSGFGAGCSKG